MEHKNIVATIYLKDGKAIKARDNYEEYPDVIELAKLYNDSGIDKIMIFDLSTTDEEHERNIQVIRNINRNIEIKVCAGGNINRMEDIKKFIYAGCLQVIVNGSKPESMALAAEASKRFGKDRILVSVTNVDFIFKHQDEMADTFHEVLILNKAVLDAVEGMTDVPHVVYLNDADYDEVLSILSRKNVRGIAGSLINNPKTDIMEMKSQLSASGIKMDNFEPNLKWSDLKKNSDGMVPVIVQDCRTDAVLMQAYMDEEAYEATIRTGKMTYFSRSRGQLWVKGETSGHFQYVKSLYTDCDYDTILAKVVQIGPACHTGSYSCFFNEILSAPEGDGELPHNPAKVFEEVYGVIQDRKEHPKEGSYTNYLFDKGIDKILKKLGEEATEIVIAAKNPNPGEIKYEICDFLYHMMVLMAEKNITWEEIMEELAKR